MVWEIDRYLDSTLQITFRKRAVVEFWCGVKVDPMCWYEAGFSSYTSTGKVYHCKLNEYTDRRDRARSGW